MVSFIMKKNLLFLAFALVTMTASAQQTLPALAQQHAVQPALRFGYFSFEQVFHTMPG